MARLQPSGNHGGLGLSAPAEMQDKVDKSIQSRHASRPKSPYNSVKVLLLQWEEDNLKVNDEVTELDKVLHNKCNFNTQPWKIPSVDPEDALIRRILDFKKGKSAGDLLILYYGGHAGGNPEQCIWSATDRPQSPELNWHSVQQTLLGSPADVLLILDCCLATLAAQRSGNGANWFLGASAKESPTAGVSRDSFTSALTREIDHHAHQYLARGNTYTVQSIHSGLVLWDRDLVYTPNFNSTY